MNFKSKKSIIIFAVLLTVAIALSVVSVMLFNGKETPTGATVPSTADKIEMPSDPITYAPQAVIGGYITAGIDFEFGNEAINRVVNL